jgi:hypothetical protein
MKSEGLMKSVSLLDLRVAFKPFPGNSI